MTLIETMGAGERTKPAIHNISPLHCRTDWQWAWDRMAVCIPFWSGGGAPHAWIRGRGWVAATVGGTAPDWAIGNYGHAVYGNSATKYWLWLAASLAHLNVLPWSASPTSWLMVAANDGTNTAYHQAPIYHATGYIPFEYRNDGTTIRFGMGGTTTNQTVAAFRNVQSICAGSYDLTTYRNHYRVGGINYSSSAAVTYLAAAGSNLAIIRPGLGYFAGSISALYIFAAALSVEQMAALVRDPFGLLRAPALTYLMGGSPWYQYLQQAGD